MPEVTPFRSIRPVSRLAGRIAALPYDVYDRKEALAETKREPLSFLRIDRAETGFPDEVGAYDHRVYERARLLLDQDIASGRFIREEVPCYYIYELTMDGRSQTGIAACSSIDDYENGIIKKHENTREEKELDRIRHVDATNAHTGPVFLAYRSQASINQIVNAYKRRAPLYDFQTPDHISHRVWRIDETETVEKLQALFKEIPCTYIADGHHRCASAVKVGRKRRLANPKHTGTEEYNRFLSVLFPHDQLTILPYNRIVRDLNGMSHENFLNRIREAGFQATFMGKQAVAPKERGCFGMVLSDGWYLLKADPKLFSEDPVKGLDVSILQEHLLAPVLGIEDPRTDNRIDFAGGIRGLSELERRVSEDMQAAFSLYPTSIEELFAVADEQRLMPPKSTWFEPKLRSGLLLHSLDERDIP